MKIPGIDREVISIDMSDDDNHLSIEFEGETPLTAEEEEIANSFFDRLMHDIMSGILTIE